MSANMRNAILAGADSVKPWEYATVLPSIAAPITDAASLQRMSDFLLSVVSCQDFLPAGGRGEIELLGSRTEHAKRVAVRMFPLRLDPFFRFIEATSLASNILATGSRWAAEP